MLVYGARFYDPAIGRFTTIDPLTEQFAHQSGYVYADNDPIGKIDFMGLSGEKVDDWYKNIESGEMEWIDGSGYQEGYEHLHEDYDMASWKSGIRDMIGYSENSILGPVKEKPSSESIKRSGGGAGYAWARSITGEENIALRAGRRHVTLGDYQESEAALMTGVMLAMPYGRMAKFALSPLARINWFGLNGGFGVGRTIGGYKLEALYANPAAGAGAGTIFSLKQLKQGGTLFRLDYGVLHSTGQLGLHSTIRYTWQGTKYGSTAQRYWYPSSLQAPFFQSIPKVHKP